MNIIITGLEMPIERESFNLTIKYNGTVLDTETGTQVAEAYELPAHGRLIDADALKVQDGWLRDSKYFSQNSSHTHITFVYSNDICNAPTIIPAEENNNDR